MYDMVIPVTSDYSPVVVESAEKVQVILTNVGPGTVVANVWSNWEGRRSNRDIPEPNFTLQLRPGNQRAITGSLISLSTYKSSQLEEKQIFAAIGAKVLNIK